MKKRFVILLVILAAFFVMAACEERNEPPENGNGIESNGNGYENGDELTPVPEPEVTPEPVFAPEATPRPAPNPEPPASASEWASRVRIGWSLGNQFDAHATPSDQARSGPGYGGFSWIAGGSYADSTVAQLEGAWLRGATVNRRMIDAVHEAGFNAIRIPVTWYKAADENYNIREDWMERVLHVVNYAVDNDFYIILNSHHDEFIFPLHDLYIDEAVHAITRIWEQVAVAFRDFDHRLAFQGLNEPRTRGSTREWTGGTPEERANLNILNQTFVDVVRGTGGNNATRTLLVPTYAAGPQPEAVRDFVLPTDTIDDGLIVALQFYVPGNFALYTASGRTEDFWQAANPEDTRMIHYNIDRAYNTFVSNGIPVVITEMGALNRNNIEVREAWAEYFVAAAHARGIPCFWWDSGTTDVSVPGGADQQTFGIFNRNTAELVHPRIVYGLLRGTWYR